MKSWPCRDWMRSPGSPTTRLTQASSGRPASGTDDVAALERFAEQASGFRQRDLDRQRRRAVAIGKFRGEQSVTDQKRRLHRSRTTRKRLGQRALGDEHHGRRPS